MCLRRLIKMLYFTNQGSHLAFLNLFVRNKMIWPFGNFWPFLILKKIVYCMALFGKIWIKLAIFYEILTLNVWNCIWPNLVFLSHCKRSKAKFAYWVGELIFSHNTITLFKGHPEFLLWLKVGGTFSKNKSVKRPFNRWWCKNLVWTDMTWHFFNLSTDCQVGQNYQARLGVGLTKRDDYFCVKLDHLWI